MDEWDCKRFETHGSITLFFQPFHFSYIAPLDSHVICFDSRVLRFEFNYIV